jgi:hypothetical protein
VADACIAFRHFGMYYGLGRRAGKQDRRSLKTKEWKLTERISK